MMNKIIGMVGSDNELADALRRREEGEEVILVKDQYLQGEITQSKVHDRALTAQELNKIFDHTTLPDLKQAIATGMAGEDFKQYDLVYIDASGMVHKMNPSKFMKIECPFCGMYPKSEQVPGQVEYQCDTIIVDDWPELPQLGKDCLMRQVARLSGALAQAQERLRDAEGTGGFVITDDTTYQDIVDYLYQHDPIGFEDLLFLVKDKLWGKGEGE